MNLIVILVGLLGLIGVALGAFGAHGMLHDTLVAHGSLDAWKTAVLYHLVHAVAALGIALVGNSPLSSAWRKRISVSWLVGVGLFSGSLYLLALGGPRWLGPITPLGGVGLLLGWALVVIGALNKAPKSN